MFLIQNNNNNQIVGFFNICLNFDKLILEYLQKNLDELPNVLLNESHSCTVEFRETNTIIIKGDEDYTILSVIDVNKIATTL